MSKLDLSKMEGNEKRLLLAKLLAKTKKRDVVASSNSQPKTLVSAKSQSLEQGIRELKKSLTLLKVLGEDNPFFRIFDGMMTSVISHQGKEVINFSGYDYLGFASDPRVHADTIDAIKKLGTSVGASRIASGERPLHQQLEKELACLFGVEDSIVFVSGYGTNQGVLGHIMGPEDLILHDAFIHRSIIDGCITSGATRIAFAHNDFSSLETILQDNRKQFRQCIILVEGIYSMDGDLPDLAKIIVLKKKYDSLLFVDEAHSLGVLGEHGRGIGEHAQIDPHDVDLWMGTLSKSLASCGGVIAGRTDIIEYLRYTAPAFVYSVGISPANAAAALSAARLLRKEPERVVRARENGRYFYDLLVKNGLNVGLSAGFAITPLIVGNTNDTIRLSNALLQEGINTQPIFYPAVEESQARLRFFITANHTKEQLEYTVDTIKRLYKIIK
ncbi:MAG: 8-amino-7-oxononanoate synthase [Paraglaciecola sp.]|jgi:8-amino-7-oxononanoate synthase